MLSGDVCGWKILRLCINYTDRYELRGAVTETMLKVSQPVRTPATFKLNVMGPICFGCRKAVAGTTRFNLDDFQILGI